MVLEVFFVCLSNFLILFKTSEIPNGQVSDSSVFVMQQSLCFVAEYSLKT